MPAPALDLADVDAVSPGLLRVHGSAGNGGFGLPVAGGHDDDGIDDLIVNEMLGEGLAPGTNDVGNLIVISGTLIRDLP